MGFKVGDNFRTNPKSLRPGGCTVYAKMNSGKILEYDKIKYPQAYMRKLKQNPEVIDCWIMNDSDDPDCWI